MLVRLESLLKDRRSWKNLARTRIDEHGPGDILHDFNALVDFLRENEVPLTGTGLLPLRVLPLINERLAHPLRLGLKRPLQKSYPPIHGLYLLVRVTGLTIPVLKGKKLMLRVDEEQYRRWRELTPTEQYFTLLEAWITRGKKFVMGDSPHPLSRSPLEQSLMFLAEIPDKGLRRSEDKDSLNWLGFSPGWHNLGLLYEFGLISIEDAPPEPGKGWNIQVIKPTRWGDDLLSFLFMELVPTGRLEEIEDMPIVERPGVLQPILQPYFPEWKRVLPLPRWKFRPGTYTFKVSLGQIWRRIVIPAEATLEDLATAILNSVDFDFDHLYVFEYSDRMGIFHSVHHSYMDERPHVTEVRIGDVPIHVGQKMKFIYDFGDWWEFDIILEHVDPEKHVAHAEIVEEHGAPPPQYGEVDEWI